MARSSRSLHIQCIAWNKHELCIKLQHDFTSVSFTVKFTQGTIGRVQKNSTSCSWCLKLRIQICGFGCCFFCCILIARCMEITEHLDICSIYCKRWKQLRKKFSRYLFVAYDLHDRNHSIHFQDCTANHKNKTKSYVRDKVFLCPKIQSYDYIASKILYS